MSLSLLEVATALLLGLIFATLLLIAARLIKPALLITPQTHIRIYPMNKIKLTIEYLIITLTSLGALALNGAVSASSSDTSVLNATMQSDGSLKITPVGVGTASVTVTGTDTAGINQVAVFNYQVVDALIPAPGSTPAFAAEVSNIVYRPAANA